MKFVLVLTLLAATAMAQAQPSGMTAAPASRPAAMASAEVLKVYRKKKRLLLKHGPIENLHMDAMTMEFGVADQRLLSRVKAGDKIRFAATRIGDDYLVIKLEVMK